MLCHPPGAGRVGDPVESPTPMRAWTVAAQPCLVSSRHLVAACSPCSMKCTATTHPHQPHRCGRRRAALLPTGSSPQPSERSLRCHSCAVPAWVHLVSMLTECSCNPPSLLHCSHMPCCRTGRRRRWGLVEVPSPGAARQTGHSALPRPSCVVALRLLHRVLQNAPS